MNWSLQKRLYPSFFFFVDVLLIWELLIQLISEAAVCDVIVLDYTTLLDVHLIVSPYANEKNSAQKTFNSINFVFFTLHSCCV